MSVHGTDTDNQDSSGRYHVSSGTEEREHREVWGRFCGWEKGRRGIRYKNLNQVTRPEPGQRMATEPLKAGDVTICSQPAIHIGSVFVDSANIDGHYSGIK